VRTTAYRIDANGRQCTVCGQYKPWTQYHRDNHRPNGYRERCRTCTAASRPASIDHSYSCYHAEPMGEAPYKPGGWHQAQPLNVTAEFAAVKQSVSVEKGG
jgi:hypothetical protein